MPQTKLTFAEKAILSKASEGIVKGLTLVAEDNPKESNLYKEFAELVENPEVLPGIIAETLTDKIIKWETLIDNPELILDSIDFEECMGLFIIIAEGIVAKGLGASHKKIIQILSEKAAMLKLVEDAKDDLNTLN